MSWGWSALEDDRSRLFRQALLLLYSAAVYTTRLFAIIGYKEHNGEDTEMNSMRINCRIRWDTVGLPRYLSVLTSTREGKRHVTRMILSSS